MPVPILDTAFLHFAEIPNPGAKTRIVAVVGIRHGDRLGTIKWFPRWRQYAFMPEAGTSYDVSCLSALIDRIGQLNQEQREVGR